MNLAIMVLSKAAGIGIGSIAMKSLGMLRSPIRKHLLMDTCELLGVIFAAELIGDKVENYTREQLESFVAQIEEMKEGVENGDEEHAE